MDTLPSTPNQHFSGDDVLMATSIFRGEVRLETTEGISAAARRHLARQCNWQERMQHPNPERPKDTRDITLLEAA